MGRFAQLGKSCAPFARGDWNAALVTLAAVDRVTVCRLLLCGRRPTLWCETGLDPSLTDDLAGLEALFGRCGTHDGVIV